MIDLSVLERFQFEYPPIGIKYTVYKPNHLLKLSKKMALCEMLAEAQKADEGFYAQLDNHNCGVGPYILGENDGDPAMVSGQIGPALGVYDDARANRQIYLDMPRLASKTAPYVLFHKVKGIPFDPDIIVLICKPSQAEVILRAKGYHNGKGWTAKGTPVAGCAYLFMYPYITGEVNMMVTGLHHGMKVRGIFPEGLIMLSIPFQVIPEVINNLKEMKWELPQYSWGGDYHVKHMKEISDSIKKAMAE